MKTIFKTGFFYRSSGRGLPGVDWARNGRLSPHIRNCPHGISINEETLKNASWGDQFVAQVYYNSIKNGFISFKGEFRIQAEDAKRWVKINGYYTTQRGNKILVIPTTLWVCTKESEEREKQLKLL